MVQPGRASGLAGVRGGGVRCGGRAPAHAGGTGLLKAQAHGRLPTEEVSPGGCTRAGQPSAKQTLIPLRALTLVRAPGQPGDRRAGQEGGCPGEADRQSGAFIAHRHREQLQA